jgi:signal transduction histidine kinase
MKSKVIKDLHELPVIHVDPLQIKKVITNLILNAEEAITGEGEIQLTTSVQDGMVTLLVSDNGCGMPSEFLENRLFKPFSTTKSQGFGIGLYQSKSIIEAHGGRIQANSQVGKGSTFTVMLPVQRE